MIGEDRRTKARSHIEPV